MKRLITIALCTFLSQICTGQVMLMFSSDSLASITSPLDVDSLFYWFAADVAVLDSAGGTISGGEGVGTWMDLSGNGYNVVQADTTKDPRWCASCGPASYPAIVFNGVDEFLASSSHWWGSDDLTVFVVMKFGNATRDAAESIISKWDYPGAARQWRVYGAEAAANYDEYFVTSSNGTAATAGRASEKSTAFSLGAWTYNGSGTFAYWKDGSSQAITTVGGTATTILNAIEKMTLGCVGDGTTNTNFLQGSISEIIVYSRALTTTERTAIENYLNRKYDLY